MGNRAMAMINGNQIKIIHALKGALCLDDETYRGMLHARHQVTSSKALTEAEAAAIIRELETAAISAGVWKRGREKFGDMKNRVGFATPRQLRMIEAMWNDVSRATTPEGRKTALRHFLKRIVGREDLRFLDPVDVRKVVAALEGMGAVAPSHE